MTVEEKSNSRPSSQPILLPPLSDKCQQLITKVVDFTKRHQDLKDENPWPCLLGSPRITDVKKSIFPPYTKDYDDLIPEGLPHHLPKIFVFTRIGKKFLSTSSSISTRTVLRNGLSFGQLPSIVCRASMPIASLIAKTRFICIQSMLTPFLEFMQTLNKMMKPTQKFPKRRTIPISIPKILWNLRLIQQLICRSIWQQWTVPLQLLIVWQEK